jgi:hypothetical protein
MVQGEFGSRWRKTFHRILGEAAIEISKGLDELEPEKAPEDRRKVLTQLANFCVLNATEILNGPIVSKNAMRAAGYDEDPKGDTRIIWLLTAAAYVSISNLLVRTGKDAAAMDYLVNAKYWIGFQDSGDLRKFVEEDAISSNHQRERNSKRGPAGRRDDGASSRIFRAAARLAYSTGFYRQGKRIFNRCKSCVFQRNIEGHRR